MSRLVAVCIATYHRPSGLDRLLASLRSIEVPTDCAIEFRLVDNDAKGSAEPVAGKWAEPASALPGRLRYEVEPTQGISAARNHALDMGPADLVATIDDDEEATPRWLAGLVASLDQAKADAVFGPVIGRFPPEAPGWVVRGRFFDRQVGAEGRPLHWKETRTGNTLVRGDWFYAKGYRYSSEFGKSGGEDIQLFRRMGEEGARFVASAESVVWEHVLPERARFRWIWRSYWSRTLTYHRTAGRHSAVKEAVLSLYRILRATLLSILSAPFLLVGRPERFFKAVLLWAIAGAAIEFWLWPSRAAGLVLYGPKS